MISTEGSHCFCKRTYIRFQTYVQERDDCDMRPVFTEDGFTFVYVRHNNLYLMSITKRNSNICLMLMFLYRLINVFQDYFGELNEESIR